MKSKAGLNAKGRRQDKYLRRKNILNFYKAGQKGPPFLT
jgi:hypothetical protein